MNFCVKMTTRFILIFTDFEYFIQYCLHTNFSHTYSKKLQNLPKYKDREDEMNINIVPILYMKVSLQKILKMEMNNNYIN